MSFPVATSNPKNSTMTLDTNLLQCIFFNTTKMKWNKCPSHSYASGSNTLSCKCPSQATYIFDYNSLYSDIDEPREHDSQQKQTTLIIVAVVLAVIFIVLIILYAAICKPKQAEYDLTQLGKGEETNSISANHSKIQNNFSQVKQSES